MELSGTGRVILGMLRIKPMSGYEIKQVVDQSTRFFWAASYGQIYPELRRLAREGLIEGEQAPRGARRRTVYTLTPAGEEVLLDWLAEPPAPPELRFEGLLKLFFLRDEERETARRQLQAMRRQNSAALRRLREIEPAARALPDGSQLLVLRSGITAFEAIESWLDEAERRLAGAPEKGSRRQSQSARPKKGKATGKAGGRK
jgi:PadR family transcriptional regulator, regulatory protein AphA